MISVNYSIEINAKAEKVYRLMIEKPSYERWTAAFCPNSSYEGSWNKGQKIVFTAPNTEGKLEGMVSEIAENIPNQFISICHKGMLKDGIEILEGPKIEEWANALENYSFVEKEGITKVEITIDITEEYKNHFDTMWVNALEKLKEICEENA